MHLAQKYVNDHLKPGLPVGGFKQMKLSASQATGLRLAISEDAYSYMFSGCVSIADAVQALDREMYTWATVKLYYSVFYLTRSLIATAGTAIVYEGTKGFTLASRPGASPVKRDGTTHKAVLAAFETVIPSSPLFSQPIDNIGAADWLMARREEANYKNSRFYEPNAPEHFLNITKIGLRKSISAYAQDDTYLYAFDPEHAMLALPMAALKLSLENLTTLATPKFISVEDSKILSNMFYDKSGPISEIIKIISKATH